MRGILDAPKEKAEKLKEMRAVSRMTYKTRFRPGCEDLTQLGGKDPIPAGSATTARRTDEC